MKCSGHIHFSSGSKYICDMLNQKGFNTYIVGGCVRDCLLFKKPYDYDICTKAAPNEVVNIFASSCNIYKTGIKHGTVTVEVNGEMCEVTTFRCDGNYADNRHPDKVSFTQDLNADLARRDFTVNAMAYNNKDGLQDPFSGRQDLKNNILRCVGNPQQRICEDALRILRALRFAAVYGFTIQAETHDAILNNVCLLKNISAQRKMAELSKLVCAKYANLILNKYKDVFISIIPQLKNYADDITVWTKLTNGMAKSPPKLQIRMAILLSVLIKPATADNSKSYEKKLKGQMADTSKVKQAMQSLAFSNKTIITVCNILSFISASTPKNIVQTKWFLNILGKDTFCNMLCVKYALNNSFKNKIAVIKARLMAFLIYKFKACITVKQLKINGDELAKLKIEKGVAIGEKLNDILAAVINGEIKNTKRQITLYVCQKSKKTNS